MFDTLKGRNEKGFAVYYVLNRTDARARNAKTSRIRSLPLDLDDAPLPEIWLGGIKPHLTVETSPGKYQCIFNIEPTTDHEGGEANCATARRGIRRRPESVRHAARATARGLRCIRRARRSLVALWKQIRLSRRISWRSSIRSCRTAEPEAARESRLGPDR